MQGWVDLVGWLHATEVYLPEDGHHPSTNRTRRKDVNVKNDATTMQNCQLSVLWSCSSIVVH